MRSIYTLLTVLLLLSIIASFGGLAVAAKEDVRYGPYIDKITMSVIRDYNTRVMAFEAKELDVLGVLPRDLDRIKKNRPDAHIIFTARRTASGSLHFNVELWPVKYPQVRKALAHLWDRARMIAESPLKGVAIKNPYIVPPTYGKWVNPKADFEKLYPYDPEKARKLLDEVFDPCPDNPNMWCDPNEGMKPVEIEILTLPEATSPTYWWIAQYIKSEAEKIGLKIKITPVSSRELDARTSAGTAQAWVIGWIFGRFPTFMYYFWHSSQIRPGGWNEWHVRNATLDKVLENFFYAETMDEAMKWCWKAQELLVDIIPWIPTYTAIGITAYSGDIDRDSLVLQYAPPMKDPVGFSWFNMNHIRFKGKKFGGVFRSYFTVDITTLNPTLYLWATEAAAIWRVYAFGAEPRPEDLYATPRIPVMFESWKAEKVTYKGKQVWKITLKLFPDIKWQDGVHATAEDLRYTLLKFGVELKTRRVYDPWMDYLIDIKVVNKTTLEIYAEKMGWAEIYYMAELFFLPKHVMEKLPNPLDDISLIPHPTKPGLTAMVGNGPFVLIKREVSYVELVWYPEYKWRHPDRTVKFLEVKLPEKVKVGESFKISVTLVDYLGERVTNATVVVTLKGPTTVTVPMRHVGNGVYEATIPSLPEGIYDVTIKASMPIMMWHLTNSYTAKLGVGKAPPAAAPKPVAPAPTAPVVKGIKIEIPGAAVEVVPPQSPPTISPPPSVKPPKEVKVEVPSVDTSMSMAAIGISIVALIASAGLALTVRR